MNAPQPPRFMGPTAIAIPFKVAALFAAAFLLATVGNMLLGAGLLMHILGHGGCR